MVETFWTTNSKLEACYEEITNEINDYAFNRDLKVKSIHYKEMCDETEWFLLCHVIFE